ncbi:tRNA (cytosine(32)/uridine(32)-2'-O)-methyltransferase TrmJ [Pokkaliibacter plantistimulans]|uniref:tRNA (cytidine/uridine-2'-O-)-methyltransferase TrmJ n=1 Tax=Proteobacteria bacterium 228 TaxID=2083153 RepID=A0A2S5KNA8_9PROT|nr:tRNA (cytosine(32)/uridine(32)-2'-O)-methyltransferase TrmJ [Pokkaliibacter plantistimulans]PPC76202.1 tRNA (cytosine(32)/uridine(32)-2'-O)-methyltransferase TrmJ [Pokkaliibacter plantistimulans]
MLERVRIVLVNTSLPANIGAAARAMKTMGLVQMVLVAPKIFPSPEADTLSSGATDILAQARVVSSLDEAIAGCRLIIGTSARSRHIPWPLLNPRAAAAQAWAELPTGEVALVFGREDRGLTNDELHKCHYHVHIPTNPDFSSLNLAAAVQVLAYEMRMRSLEDDQVEAPFWGVDWDIDAAPAEDIERLFVHLEQVLVKVDFLDPENPRQLMTRLRRLFLRSRLDTVELNVLRGFLTAIEKSSK